MLVRASIGTLSLLRLCDLRMDDKPSTAYLLQYSEDGCLGECGFCPQSKLSRNDDKSMLARVRWPPVELKQIMDKLKEARVFSRICLESVLKEGFVEEVLKVVEYIVSKAAELPLSVAITPVHMRYLVKLKGIGVDRVGIGLDAASEKVFDKVKKPYSWSTYMNFIHDAVRIFGPRRVTVHLIRGLGESERELVTTMEKLMKMGAEIALFAFTPIKGTPMERHLQPSIYSFRRIQLVRYLLSQGFKLKDAVSFKGDRVYLRDHIIKEVLRRFEDYAEAFLTSGCPGCNRPFYNESPRGPYYNIPSRRFLSRHADALYEEVEKALEGDEPDAET